MWTKLKKLFSSYAFNLFLITAIAALVFWLTWKNNPQDVWVMLLNADRKWVAVFLLAVVANRCLSGWTICEETRLYYPHFPLSQGIVNAFVGGFFNEITPSATGGQFAQVYLFRKQGVNVTDSASVLWLDFILYQSTVVGLVLLLLILKFHTFYIGFSQLFFIVTLGFLVNTGVIMSMWALLNSSKFHHWLTTTGISIGTKLKLVKNKEQALNSLEKNMAIFEKEVEVLSRHHDLTVKVCIGQLLRLLLFYSMPWFAAKALYMTPINAGYLDALALTSFVTMVNAFIPTPGSSGGTEGVFLLMFSTIYGKSSASAVMILWRFMSYYLDMIIGGVIFLFARSFPFHQSERISATDERQQ